MTADTAKEIITEELKNEKQGNCMDVFFRQMNIPYTFFNQLIHFGN